MLKKQVLLIFISLLVIAPLFHNCGNQMASQAKAFMASSACNTDMLPVFEETYYTFFADNNCKRCHSSTGIQGIPHFAEPDSKIGLSFFMNIGPDRVENKLRSGHQGFNFSNLQPDLIKHKKTWTDELQAGSCTNQDVATAGKTLGFFEPDATYPTVNVLKESMTDWQTISWNLDNGNLSSTDGVEISIDIKVNYTQIAGSKVPQNYLVNNIKVKTTKHGIHVKGVYVLLNNKTYYVTTFKGLDTEIQKGNDFQAVAEGSAAAIFVKDANEKYENADQWSIQIEVFDEI